MSNRAELITTIEKLANRMRRHALDMALSSGVTAHFGGGLSIVDVVATLYGGVMRYDASRPDWDERDRFILSKGHGVLGYYPALAESGFFSVEELKSSFQRNSSDLIAHPVMNLDKGIEFSNGSLGMGLSLGIGVALAGRMAEKTYRVFVVMGDGECNEGSVWEAAMSAAHYRLQNLVAIVDHNQMQSDGPSEEVLRIGNLADKWQSFGWDVRVVDGHDVGQLFDALTQDARSDKPVAIIANTVKGKGISFMEANNDWHHKKLSQEQYEAAISEIGE